MLASARMRFRNAKEEREQFDEASNEIIAHLKAKVQNLFLALGSHLHKVKISFSGLYTEINNVL